MSCCATLALSLIAVIYRQDADAQDAPLGGLTQQFSATVPTANGFTNPPQLAQKTGRQVCQIEYLAQTPLATGLVFFGPVAPTVTNTAFELPNFGFINCGSGDGTVDTNAVWISSTATNDIFVFRVK